MLNVLNNLVSLLLLIFGFVLCSSRPILGGQKGKEESKKFRSWILIESKCYREILFVTKLTILKYLQGQNIFFVFVVVVVVIIITIINIVILNRGMVNISTVLLTSSTSLYSSKIHSNTKQAQFLQAISQPYQIVIMERQPQPQP